MGVQSMASTGVMASNPIPGSSGSLMGPKRWYFSESQLRNTPTVRGGLALEKELSYRQQAANFIQDMGQLLDVSLVHKVSSEFHCVRSLVFGGKSRGTAAKI